MRELRFDGLSPDGTRLILAGKDGQKWSVVIDERIEAAVRRDRARIGQVEIEQAGVLRPREIQARIRSGATAEDVAAASGLSIEHIRRFEGPVLTERAWVAQQAQTTEVRRPGSDIELGDLVSERLIAEGVDPAEISWDAWRRDDGAWVVIATFPIEPNTHIATWTYDSSSRTMTVVDENARALSAIDPQGPLRLAASRPMLTTVAPLVDAGPSVVASLPDRQLAGEETAEGAHWADDAVDSDSEADWEAADAADPVLSDDEVRADAGVAGDSVVEGEAVAEQEAEAEAWTAAAPEADADPGPEAAAEAAAGDDADADAQVQGNASDSKDEPLFPTSTPPAHRSAGRPSVPSFDDILFGPGKAK